MAASKPSPTSPQESIYPAIEAFIDKATSDDITALLKPIHTSLSTLKGPQAAHGKKIEKALERTQELLQFLLQVREKIEQDRRGKR
jgi:ABC-type transporter Mla subunit MlaD